MAVTRAASKPTATQPQAQSNTKKPSSEKATPKKPPTEKQLQAMKPKDMPKSVLGAKPSPAFMVRFLRGRKPGTGILSYLPCEIVEMIAVYLDVHGLANLRLTCKELESKTLRYFTTKYFSRVAFIPSKYALETLLAMSESRMGQYIRTLSLGPPSLDQGVIYLPGPQKPPAKEKEITFRMMKYSEENRMMRNLGLDADLIRRSLENLRGVTKLEFTFEAGWGCDCGCCGYKKSYGEHYMHKKITQGEAKFLNEDLDITQSLTRLLSITLHAAQAANLKLDCIDAQLTERPYMDGGGRLLGFADFPLDFTVGSQLGQARYSSLANLSTLKLYISFRRTEHGLEYFLGRFDSFLSQTPSLRTLGMSFAGHVNTLDFLHGLTSLEVSKRIPRLELNGVDAQSGSFPPVLQPLRDSLQGLRMSQFLITADDHIRVLRWLRDSMRQLNEIDLDNLFDDWLSPAKYNGPAMRDFLNTAINLWTEENK